jgi:hypothetical protein
MGTRAAYLDDDVVRQQLALVDDGFHLQASARWGFQLVSCPCQLPACQLPQASCGGAARGRPCALCRSVHQAPITCPGVDPFPGLSDCRSGSCRLLCRRPHLLAQAGAALDLCSHQVAGRDVGHAQRLGDAAGISALAHAGRAQEHPVDVPAAGGGGGCSAARRACMRRVRIPHVACMRLGGLDDLEPGGLRTSSCMPRLCRQATAPSRARVIMHE